MNRQLDDLVYVKAAGQIWFSFIVAFDNEFIIVRLEYQDENGRPIYIAVSEDEIVC